MEHFHTETIHDETFEAEEKKSGFLRFSIDVLETLILSVILFAAINAVSARIRVDGSSMEPTLHSGEFVIVNKLSYKLGMPEIGDVVIFHYPRDPEQEYVKRVIGLPGDKVELKDGNIHINGKIVVDPKIASNYYYNQGKYGARGKKVIVPEGKYFFLGDNSISSKDGREWGFADAKDIIGKAVLTWWPPKRITMLE